MLRPGFAIASLVAACGSDSFSAPSPGPVPVAAGTGTAIPPEPSFARDGGGASTSAARPIMVAVNDVAACASFGRVANAQIDTYCWTARDPLPADLEEQPFSIDDAVGHGDWFLGRTPSSTRVWGRGAVGAPAGEAITFGTTQRPYIMGGAAAGARHGCVVDSLDDLYCWGDDSFCQTSGEEACAGGTRAPTDLSKLLGNGIQWTDVATTDASTCAVASTGTGATANVYCWGANANGETGQPASPRSKPMPLPLVPPVPSNQLAVAAGAHHACAIVQGDLYCWGKNAPPAKVDLSDVVGKVTKLALGGDRTCFVVAPRSGSQPSRAFCLAGDRVVGVPLIEDVQALAVSDTRACAIARRIGATSNEAGLYCWRADGEPALVTVAR